MNNTTWKSTLTCLLILVCALFLGGCGVDLLPSGEISEKEINNTFDQAQTIDMGESDSVQISGSVSSTDCDVFLLGSFTAGDTISVQVRSTNSLLTSGDFSIALFDKNQDVAWLEDDVTCKSTFQDVFTYQACEDSNFYLAICKSSSASNGTSNYELQVDTGTGIAPLPTGQIVYLNFSGTNYLTIGGIPMYNLKPFSEIALDYNAQDLADDIVSLVKTDYSGYKVTFISSYTASAPSAAHSTVYITASTGDYYGLADDVDWYDANHEDNAVIYAGSMVYPNITRGQFIQMAANVISHETGHLLGLTHTDDDTELMDEVTPTSKLEQDQSFGRAPLAEDEFPIGYQDALELLAFSIGML